MKYLHIMKFDKKFTIPYIKFINSNFESQEHLFLIIGKDVDASIVSIDNVKELTKKFKSLIMLLDAMYASKKIFLHSLFFRPLLLLILSVQPWILKKSSWLIWGGDLYRYKYRKVNFKSNIYEILRKFVIKNTGGLITHIKGDYELAKKWYHAKGKYHYSFMYTSNLYKEYRKDITKDKNDTIVLLVGNSATSTNNHLEVFEKLKKHKDENIQVVCPLSYGDKEYRDLIINEGTKIFKDKFKPIVDFFPIEEYVELLFNIDIAIFNHKRQQAVGNITTLLGLGKKVYTRDDITTWDFFIEHELKVFSINKDFNNLLVKIDENTRITNIENVKSRFSEENMIKDWSKIFLDSDR